MQLGHWALAQGVCLASASVVHHSPERFHASPPPHLLDIGEEGVQAKGIRLITTPASHSTPALKLHGCAAWPCADLRALHSTCSAQELVKVGPGPGVLAQVSHIAAQQTRT